MSSHSTLFVGIGSAHGDDQAGWLVAERLAACSIGHDLQVRKAKSPASLLHWLDGGVQRLIVCDACHSGGQLGQVRRWAWPIPELETMAWSGTHDLSLPTVLALGQRLGRLPATVIVWAIEGQDPPAAEAISHGVSEAVLEVVQRIVLDLGHTTPGSCRTVRD